MKLPPLNVKEDVEKFDAFSETKEINFTKCDHKQVKFEQGRLRCVCGSSWEGERLNELFELLTKK